MEKHTIFSSKRKTVVGEKFLMSSWAHVRLTQEHIKIVYFKSIFDAEFQTVDLNRNVRVSNRFEESRPTFPPDLPVKSAVLIITRNTII